MIDPRRASLRLLALLTFAAFAAALPAGRAAAQSAPANQNQSPNGKIVFQSTQGGDGYVSDVYVMDADGRRQTRLTDSPSNDAYPVWSPKGDQIAFVSDRGGNGYEIYLMNPDGSNQRLLRNAEHGGPLNAVEFEWSPDGTMIKFLRGGKIFVVEAVAPGGGDSTAPVQDLSPNSSFSAYDSAAAWSPDCQRIALISTGTAGFPDLFVMNSDGTGRTQLTFTPEAESNPRWVQGGARIAYDSHREGPRELFVINPDGTGDAKLSSGVGSLSGAVWSPDGARLAFVVGTGKVYTANADGSQPTLLTNFQANGGRVFWSPDGSKVVFHSYTGNSVDVFVVNADGSRQALNYTKTRRDDEFSYSWQRVATH